MTVAVSSEKYKHGRGKNNVKADPEAVTRKHKKSLVSVSVIIPVALLHFFTGSAYRGPCPALVNGYLLDIRVPFAFYFLLCPQDAVFRFLRPWYVKGLPVFVIASSVEAAQWYSIPLFGRTFDPLDIVMYGMGVTLAAGIDTRVFPRILGL